MKIEIGESLLRSWLRHVKRCQFAELNWKPSPQWGKTLECSNTNTSIFDEASKQFGVDLFKKSSLSQLLLQGEIDALGACFSPSSVQLYACDIAFHSKGLLYGSKSETVLRVTKKLIRSALLLNSFFGTKDACIIFASPKVSLEVEREITQNANYLTEAYSRHNLKYSFEIFCNSNFNTHILKEVISISDNVEDTSELFLRSYQMVNMFTHENKQNISNAYKQEKQKTKTDIVCNVPYSIIVRGVTVQSTRSGSDSQGYLQNTIKKLLPVLTFQEIGELQDKVFCNTNRWLELSFTDY